MTIHVHSGPWDIAQIQTWLGETVVPLRLATSGRNGPLVQSLWFDFSDDSLWCATQADSVLVQRIERDPHVGWEVSPDLPPYRGTRGKGTAELINESDQVEAVLSRLVDRYGQSGTSLANWLLGRIDSEVVVRIGDLRVSSWDYRPRM
jgi:nitroimidazol reductase NimA-like FMN-containing flavoprotein (pyridoxamine 5'-phosphate oxidase superfamily)